MCRVKEAIHIRLHLNNVNRDSGCPRSKNTTTGEQCDSGPPREQISGWNSKDRKCTHQSCWKTSNHSRASCFIRLRMTSRPHRLKKTSSVQSKRHDLRYTWLHRETNEKTYLLLLPTTTNNHNLFYEMKISFRLFPDLSWAKKRSCRSANNFTEIYY